MKNLKRVLSLMMAVLLCFGLFPGSALAAENDYDGYLAMIEYKGRRYSLSENLPCALWRAYNRGSSSSCGSTT